MTEAERRELWDGLSILEDHLGGGARTAREEPDFTRPMAAGREAGAGRAGAREGLDAIRAEALACARCRLSEGRSTVVFGVGAENPLVLVVGEGPGAEEDAQGLPFVGPAGKLLDRMLAAVGLSRETNCYIANVVKCRPPMNRDPAPDEEEACVDYLRRQAAALRPRLILCVGRVAAQALTGSKAGINKLRGTWHSFEGIPLIATFHPSALLRDEALKRPAWEDLKKLRDAIAAFDAAPESGSAVPSPSAGSGAAADDAPAPGAAPAPGR